RISGEVLVEPARDPGVRGLERPFAILDGLPALGRPRAARGKGTAARERAQRDDERRRARGRHAWIRRITLAFAAAGVRVSPAPKSRAEAKRRRDAREV